MRAPSLTAHISLENKRGSLLIFLQKFDLEVTFKSKALLKCLAGTVCKKNNSNNSSLIIQSFHTVSKIFVCFQRCHCFSPRTAFRLSTAGSATKCFRAHWRFVLTTPTCRCPGGDSEVSTDRDKMAVSPSVSQEPDRDKDKGLVVPGQPCFIARAHPVPFSLPPSFIQCRGDNNLTWLHVH